MSAQIDVDTMDNILSFVDEIFDSSDLTLSSEFKGYFRIMHKNIGDFKIQKETGNIQEAKTAYDKAIKATKRILNPDVDLLEDQDFREQWNSILAIVRARVAEKTGDLKNVIANAETEKQKILDVITHPKLKDDLTNPYIKEIYRAKSENPDAEITDAIASTVKGEMFRFSDFAKLMSDAKYDNTMSVLASWINDANLTKLNEDLKSRIAIDTQNIQDTIGELNKLFTVPEPQQNAAPAPVTTGGVRKRRTPRDRRKNKRTRRHYNK